MPKIGSIYARSLSRKESSWGSNRGCSPVEIRFWAQHGLGVIKLCAQNKRAYYGWSIDKFAKINRCMGCDSYYFWS